MKLLSVVKIAWVVVLLLYCGCAEGTRNLLAGTSNDIIKERSSKMPTALWRVPLGPALVEDMQIVGLDRLIVCLRKDFPGLPNLDIMLVDTANGRVVWRFERNSDRGLYQMLFAFKNRLLFRIERGKTISLLALDFESGRQAWTSDMDASGTMYMPVLASSRVIVLDQRENAVDIRGLDLESGKTVWQKTEGTEVTSPVLSPIVDGTDILVFSKGIMRFSSFDGRRVFFKPEVSFNENSPPPQLDADDLLFIDAANNLICLNASTGKMNWTFVLPGSVMYTNIFPYGTRIYLRGITFEGKGKYLICSVRRGKAQILWSHTSDEESISNLLESDGILYFGTPTSLVALDADSGKQLFSNVVTTTGRTFTIHVRKMRSQVVYIGELVVAAYDAKTGALRFKQGMTPICPECHLNGLDAAAIHLEEELKYIDNKYRSPTQIYGGLSNFASMESLRYQNLSNTYWAQSLNTFHSGDSSKSWMLEQQAEAAGHEARLQSTTSFVYAVVQIGIIWQKALETGAVKTSIDRQELFRKSILSAYDKGETEEYVYRPHLAFSSGDQDGFATVSVVHLGSGKRRDVYMSPRYLSYGLWNLIDFEKKVAYHHGIGMDPSAYELSEARRLYPYSSARTINSFLIAMPIEVPR